MNKLEITQELLNLIYAEGEKQYPNESCGFILGRVHSKREAVEVVCVPNMQNELHQQDAVRYPRDAKTAYAINPKDMESITKDAKSRGLAIIAIFHSHPEHGVYFSDEDKGMAAPWGEPLFPDLSYVVVSVYGGKVKNASDFYWDDRQKDFVEEKIL